jgi:putative hydrolase of HD superfamily
MKLPPNLTVLLKFFKTSGELKKVLRYNKATKRRRENSAEHSWSVALFSWIIADEIEKEFSQKLNQTKMLKMALIHDLIEIYAGDASVWLPEKRKQKSKLEAQAATKLFGSLPPKIGREMMSLWQEFEANQTLEAKVVKSIDWISAVIQKVTTLQGWTDLHVTSKMLDQKLNTRVSFSRTLTKIYQHLRNEAVKKGLLDD